MEPVSARLHSRAAVLDSVFTEGSVTRAGISARTGLSLATVSRAVEEFIAEGILDEGQQLPRSGRGRRSTFIRLGETVGTVVGVDLGATACRLCCTDLIGQPLGRLRLPTPPGLSAAALAAWLADSISAVHADARTAGTLIGVAVALPAAGPEPGAVVRPTQRPTQRPTRRLAQLAGRELQRCLGQALGVPVVLENDSSMALLGELATGAAAGRAHAVLLTLGTDVSAGIAIDGEILRGRAGIAGQFGWLHAAGPDRPLRELLSVDGILASAAARNIGLRDIEDLFPPDSGERFQVLRERFVTGLMTAVSVAALCYDPEVIVFNGRMLPLAERVLPELRARLAGQLPAVPELRVTALGGFAGAIGAAHVAVRAGRATLCAHRSGSGRVNSNKPSARVPRW